MEIHEVGGAVSCHGAEYGEREGAADLTRGVPHSCGQSRVGAVDVDSDDDGEGCERENRASETLSACIAAIRVPVAAKLAPTIASVKMKSP